MGYYNNGLLKGRNSFLSAWKKEAVKNAKVTTNKLGMKCLKLEVPTTKGMRSVLICLPQPDIGFDWSDIKHGVSKVGKAAKGTLKNASALLNSAEAEKIAMLAGTVMPGADTAFKMAKSMSNQIDAASKGSVSAKKKISQIMKLAKSGNANAKNLVALGQGMTLAKKEQGVLDADKLLSKAFSGDDLSKKIILIIGVQAAHGDPIAKRKLNALNKIHGAKKKGIDVRGLVFSRGVRSPLVAATTDPSLITRGLYLRGMGLKKTSTRELVL